MKAARALYPHKACKDVALAALLYADQPGADGSPALGDMGLYLPSGRAAAGQLAEAMEDMGYAATASVETMVGILRCAGEVTDAGVGQVLGMMARTHSGLPASPVLPITAGFNADFSHLAFDFELAEQKPGATAWHVPHFVQAVRAVCPTLNWRAALLALDAPSFRVRDVEGVQLLLSAYSLVASDAFPVEAFLGRWQNTAAQLALLKICISGPPHIQELFQTSARRTPRDPSLRDSVLWGSVDLIEALVALSDAESMADVLPLLEAPKAAFPELLALGLVHCKESWGPLHRTVLGSLLARFISSRNPQDTALLERLWGVNSSLVVQGMVDMYRAPGSKHETRSMKREA